MLFRRSSTASLARELLVTKGDEMQAYSAKGEFQGS